MSAEESPVLSLGIAGPEAQAALRDLSGWLASEDELRGRLELRRKPIVPGQLGGVLDVLTVALGSGGAGAVLGTSLSTWLIQRRADVSVTVTGPDGRKVTVDVHRAADPAEIIREVGKLAEPGDPR
ncbi:MAG TPA: hypothetical protein VGN81_10240 [Pseudonocardiaceae bacterium]|jgi:hypothetical protein